MVSDLVEFLRARIDEDEQNARDYGDDGTPGTWSHWALAVCESHRRIIDRIEQLAGHLDSAGLMLPDQISADLLDGLVAELALPYAEHPDWREEWRP